MHVLTDLLCPLRTATGWLAVHDVRRAVVLYGLACAGAALFGAAEIADFGPVRFEVPLPAGLLVPVLAALAAAVALCHEAREVMALAARRLWPARLVWLLVATGGGLLPLVGCGGDPLAVVRNYLLFFAISVLGAVSAGSIGAVLPPVAYLLPCLLFGQRAGDDPGLRWWAAVLDPVGGSGLPAALVLAAGAGVAYLSRGAFRAG